MKSYHALAWKELKAQKITSVLILIALVLSTLMTTVIGQSWGIIQALRQQQAGMLNGCRYATFHNLIREQKTLLEEDRRLSSVGSNIILGTSILKNSGLSLQLREYDAPGLAVYPVLSQLSQGRLPQKAGEIALPADALQYLGFAGGVGDTITLDLSVSLLEDTAEAYHYQAEFTVCGVLPSNYLAYVSGIVCGIAGPGSAGQNLPAKYRLYSTDFRTADKQSFQQTVDDLAARLGIPRGHIQYNWLYLNALGVRYDQKDNGTDAGSGADEGGLSYMLAAGVLIGALVLAAAGLVIYNILKISVSRRRKEYGTLRAIGAQQGQLYRLVAGQLILLCLAGIPLGALIGVLSAGGLTQAATGLFTPETFLVQNTEELNALIAGNSTGKLPPLLLSAVITLLFAFLAAMPAARYAAKVPPVVAMRGVTSQVKRKRRHDKPIRHFEAFYARLNLRRNAGRSALTILSLVMSITVFVALQAFSGLLDASRDVQKLHLGDYSLTNESIGFEPSVLADLQSQAGVSAVYTLKYSLYKQESDGSLPVAAGFKLQPSETLQIIGVDEERLKLLLPSLTAEQIQALKDGKACLIKNPITLSYEGKQLAATSFAAGDTVTIADVNLQVLGNCDAVGLDNQGYVNGVQVVVFDPVYDRLTGKNTYAELYPVLADGADLRAVEEKIEQICAQTAGSRRLSYQNTDKQLEESYRQIRLLAWGLILLIGLIGLLNIINTTYTNIHTRVREIGMQRAIGMSAASLYRTFLWEGAYYGVIAGGIGALSGYICTLFAAAAATDKLALAPFPFGPVLQAGLVATAACLLATGLPLRRIAGMSIVEAIETVE